jgi:hypothetical protein
MPASLGEVAERPKAAVLKTVEGKPSQGSNPCLSAIIDIKNPQLATVSGFFIAHYGVICQIVGDY